MALEWRWRPSRRLLACVWAGHALALAALWLSGLPWPWAGAASALVLASVWLDWRHRHCACAGDDVVGLRHRDGEWSLLVRSGECAAELLPSGVAAPWLLVLRFRRAASRRVDSVLLLADSMDAGSLRQLRRMARSALGHSHP